MEKEILFTKSIREKKMIIYNNFIYNFDCIRNNKRQWRCTKCKCCGFLYTNINDTTVLIENEHLHLEETFKIKADLIKKKIYNKVIESNESFHDIFIDAVAVINEESLGNIPLPNYDNLRDH
ncbi:hypothetical protein DMUE_5549 [Dictyocoela muelleri]|nr:hypothetical protein DMUE_5549 [Dictyocoela muelleri]